MPNLKTTLVTCPTCGNEYAGCDSAEIVKRLIAAPDLRGLLQECAKALNDGTNGRLLMRVRKALKKS